MRTEYRIDDFQQTYFVIDSFEQLLRATLDTDFAPLYRRLAGKLPIAPDQTVPGDRELGTLAPRA
jgi:phenylalanine-4-hydroxylase